MELSVVLLEHTPDPERLIAAAARLCYSSVSVDEIMEKQTPEKNSSLVENLLAMGHESPVEHISFTFAIEGVSRALSHQLVRHRLASYSQQSQRYVSMQQFNYILPPTIASSREGQALFLEQMQTIQQAYDRLMELGIPGEDARYLLPNACETKLVMTMNARSLFNFFSLRICRRAQWEIRSLAIKMRDLVRPVAPSVFANTGPYCERHGVCNQGKYSCGHVGTGE